MCGVAAAARCSLGEDRWLEGEGQAKCGHSQGWCSHAPGAAVASPWIPVHRAGNPRSLTAFNHLLYCPARPVPQP